VNNFHGNPSHKCGITQCHLPPDTGKHAPALTQASKQVFDLIEMER